MGVGIQGILMALFISIAVFSLGLVGYAIFTSKKRIFPEGAQTEIKDEGQILKVSIPQVNDKYFTAAYNFLTSLHGLSRRSGEVPLISLELVSRERDGLEFYIKVPANAIEYVESQLYAQYPSANVDRVGDYVASFERWGEGIHVSATRLMLEKSFVYPLRTIKDFDRDPLVSIAGSMENLLPGEEAYIQFVIRPYPDVWQEEALKVVEELRKGNEPLNRKRSSKLWSVLRGLLGVFVVLANSFLADNSEFPKQAGYKLDEYTQAKILSIEEKAKQNAFQTEIRIVVKATMPERSLGILEGIVSTFRQFAKPYLNSLVEDKGFSPLQVLEDFRRRYIDEKNTTILSIEELATLYHLPQIDRDSRFLYKVTSTKLPYPKNLPIKQGVIFAVTDYRGRHLPFGIKEMDKRRHMYIIGKSGTGKSTLIQNMVVGEILKGNGVALIDPHGDLAEEILDFIPKSRVRDTVYFNPADSEYPIGFNPVQLKGTDQKQRDIIADSIVGVFKKVFSSWGPRLEYLLYNSIITVLESQNTTLLSVQRLLVDKNYRKRVLSHVKDPAILNFWRTEFAGMEQNRKLITEAISPIQNKIGRFLSPRLIRNILGQVRSTINIRKIMDEGKILIVNLSKGKIGEESATLLGGLLVTRIYSAALERADIPEEERRTFSLYIDEVHSFTTDAFTSIFSEARKYGLALIMAHQFLDQLSDSVQDAIFGNVGTIVSFNIGQEDAYTLAREFSPFLKPEDFLLLQRFEIYLKLMIDGQTSNPFSAKTLPLIYKPYNLSQEVMSYTRDTYCIKREVIEEKLARWLQGGRR